MDLGQLAITLKVHLAPTPLQTFNRDRMGIVASVALKAGDFITDTTAEFVTSLPPGLSESKGEFVKTKGGFFILLQPPQNVQPSSSSNPPQLQPTKTKNTHRAKKIPDQHHTQKKSWSFFMNEAPTADRRNIKWSRKMTKTTDNSGPKRWVLEWQIVKDIDRGEELVMINNSEVPNRIDSDNERLLDIGNFALRKVTISRIKDDNFGLVVSLENPILMEVSQKFAPLVIFALFD